MGTSLRATLALINGVVIDSGCRPDWWAPSIEGMVLEEGISFLPRRIPKRVADKFPSTEPKQCYKNSVLLAQSKPDLVYTEGYIRIHDCDLAIAHAWCVDKKTREVYDPTIHDGRIVSAYIGIPLDLGIVITTAISRCKYGVFDDPEHGFPFLRTKENIRKYKVVF